MCKKEILIYNILSEFDRQKLLEKFRSSSMKRFQRLKNLDWYYERVLKKKFLTQPTSKNLTKHQVFRKKIFLRARAFPQTNYRVGGAEKILDQPTS